MIGMFGKVPLITRIFIYVFLSLAALVLLYPFIYMISTSLKPSGEIYGNVGLLPYGPVTISVNGKDEAVYDYNDNGQVKQLIRVGAAQSLGEFVDPADPSKTIEAPMGKAKVKGDNKVKINGQEYQMFTVDLGDGNNRDLARMSVEKVSKYAPPDQTSQIITLKDSQVTRQQKLDPQWDNYRKVLTLQNMGRALLNTSLVTLLVTLGQLATSAIGGYAFARLNFPGRNRLFVIYLGTIMVPFVVIIIPLYQLMNAMGWINRLVSLIIPWFFTAYGTFFMRQFFMSIPKDLEEAAMIDGASRFGILWRVFLPLSTAPLGTLATFTFLYSWNSFIWPLISINAGNSESQVISLTLNILRGQVEQGPGLVMAGATLSVLPAVVIFIFAQRYFIEGVSTTGLAGR